MMLPNKALHLTAFPLCSKAAGELGRYTVKAYSHYTLEARRITQAAQRKSRFQRLLASQPLGHGEENDERRI